VGFLVFFGVIIFFVLFVRGAIKAAGGGTQGQSVQLLDRLEQTGTPARGLVLGAANYSVGVTVNMRRFERRTMAIDVEIPGREAYVVSGDFLVPRGLVEVVPGVSLELAVDPSNPNNVAVLGPGGFTGPWIRLGPPQPY
jgi:hypothetical protein